MRCFSVRREVLECRREGRRSARRCAMTFITARRDCMAGSELLAPGGCTKCAGCRLPRCQVAVFPAANLLFWRQTAGASPPGMLKTPSQVSFVRSLMSCDFGIKAERDTVAAFSCARPCACCQLQIEAYAINSDACARCQRDKLLSGANIKMLREIVNIKARYAGLIDAPRLVSLKGNGLYREGFVTFNRKRISRKARAGSRGVAGRK